MTIDYQMVLGEIRGEGSRRNDRYCKERSIWPIVEANGRPVQRGDSNCSDLKKKANKPLRKTRTAAPLISDAIWMLADQRMALGQTHRANQQE